MPGLPPARPGPGPAGRGGGGRDWEALKHYQELVETLEKRVRLITAKLDAAEAALAQRLEGDGAGGAATGKILQSQQKQLESLSKALEAANKARKEKQQAGGGEGADTAEVDELIATIEHIEKGYGEVQDQNSNLLTEVVAKQDRITGLQGEVAKLKQSLASEEASHKYMKDDFALAKKASKDLRELGKKLDAEKGELAAKLEALNKAFADAQGALASARAEAGDAQRLCGEKDQEAAGLRARLADVEKQLVEARAQAAGAEGSYYPNPKRARLMGATASATPAAKTAEQERAEMLAKVAKKELDEYRKMVQCIVCEQNVVDCIVRPCNHMFCKQCLDKRFELRQRQCPKCMISISKTNVSDVYFEIP